MEYHTLVNKEQKINYVLTKDCNPGCPVNLNCAYGLDRCLIKNQNEMEYIDLNYSHVLFDGKAFCFHKVKRMLLDKGRYEPFMQNGKAVEHYFCGYIFKVSMTDILTYSDNYRSIRALDNYLIPSKRRTT